VSADSLVKMAISHALAQSCKLNIYEAEMADLVERVGAESCRAGQGTAAVCLKNCPSLACLSQPPAVIVRMCVARLCPTRIGDVLGALLLSGSAWLGAIGCCNQLDQPAPNWFNTAVPCRWLPHCALSLL
jgi:hypothetical protein